MNITELNGQIIYLEDMDGLTIEGSVDTPLRITLSYDDGETILSSAHYADFSGFITLNLKKVIKDIVKPSIPDNVWRADSTHLMNLVFSIDNGGYATPSYAFTLNCFSRDALTMLSDIDSLDVPLMEDLPFPIAFHTPALSLDLSCEYGDKVSLIESFNLGSDCSIQRGLASKFVHLDTLHNYRPFRFLIAHGVQEYYRGPVYHPTPGHFELYLFKNKFGALELFPMAGDLQLMPDFKFDTTTIGGVSSSRIKTEDITLSQYVGALTRKASKALADMLLQGYGYRYTDGSWKKIIITEVKLSLRQFDTLHKQSFSFRYAEPIDISNITL